MKVGDTYNLNRTLKPASSNDKTTWITSDKTIANPNNRGIFTALKPGSVTITAKTLSGQTDTVIIHVKPLEDGEDVHTPTPTNPPITPETPDISNPPSVPEQPEVPAPSAVPEKPDLPSPTAIPEQPEEPTPTPIITEKEKKIVIENPGEIRVGKKLN